MSAKDSRPLRFKNATLSAMEDIVRDEHNPDLSIAEQSEAFYDVLRRYGRARHEYDLNQYRQGV